MYDDDDIDFDKISAQIGAMRDFLRDDKSPSALAVKRYVAPILEILMRLAEGHDNAIAELVGDAGDEEDGSGDGLDQATVDGLETAMELLEEMMSERDRSNSDVQRLSKIRVAIASVLDSIEEDDGEEEEA